MTGLFLLAAAAFFLLRQRVWQVSPTSHEGFSAFNYPQLGDNPFGYFVFFAYPVSVYLSAITYGRSRLLGNFCYDLLLTLTGLAFFLAGRLITGSDTAAFFGGGLFYASFAARQILGPSIHLEAYTYFFAALGLLGVALALQAGSTWGVFAAMIVASLSFWSKLTSREALWPLALIVLQRGLGLDLLAGCAALALMAALFLLLLAQAHRHAPDICLFFGLPGRGEPLQVRVKRFLAYQKHELALHYDTASFCWRKVLRQALAQCRQSLGVFLPVVLLFAAHLGLDSVPWQTKALLVCFLAITATNCLTRLSFTFLSWIVGSFPLGLGAGLALEAAAPHLGTHWAVAVLPCVVVLSLSGLNYQALTYWTDSLTRAVEYYRHTVLALKGRVSPEDHVFLNALDVDIYLSLGCRTPPVWFLFMRYVATFYLRGFAEYRHEFVQYFRTCRPKFFIDTAKDIDLDYLEEITGLSYRLVRDGLAHVYLLEGAGEPRIQGDWDPDRLYGWNTLRHQREARELLARAEKRLAEAQECLDAGRAAEALDLSEDVLLSNTGLAGLRMLRARCLVALGRADEALENLLLRLGGVPEDTQARSMAEELLRTGHKTPHRPGTLLERLWTGLNGGARAFDPLPLSRNG